jgi:hypothetical protein
MSHLWAVISLFLLLLNHDCLKRTRLNLKSYINKNSNHTLEYSNAQDATEAVNVSSHLTYRTELAVPKLKMIHNPQNLTKQIFEEKSSLSEMSSNKTLTLLIKMKLSSTFL